MAPSNPAPREEPTLPGRAAQETTEVTPRPASMKDVDPYGAEINRPEHAADDLEYVPEATQAIMVKQN